MKKSTIIFSVVNIVGVLCLLGFVWSARELALDVGRDSYDFGDSAGFFLYVAPALLLCLVVNIAWVGMALWALIKRRGFQPAAACLLMVIIWTVTISAARELARLPTTDAQKEVASSPN